MKTSRSHYKKSIISIGLIILLLISITIIYPGYQETNGSVKATSSWKQETESDFKNGTFQNLTITSNGEVKLATSTNYIKDDFFDESNINFKQNVVIDQTLGEVRQLKTDVDFNKVYGGTDSDWTNEIHATTDGGFITVGRTGSYGSGGWDVWLVKINRYGEMEWNRTFGSPDSDNGASVKETLDGGYIITGSTPSLTSSRNDMWLIKTDSQGIEQWNKTYGGSDGDGGNSVLETSNGDFVVCGYSGSFTTTIGDIWVIKTNKTGHELWNKTYNQSKSDIGKKIRKTADGGYIILAQSKIVDWEADIWIIKIKNNGVMEWNLTIQRIRNDFGYSIEQTFDGGYIVVGSTDYNINGGVSLIKIDKNGNMKWNKTYSWGLGDGGFSVKQTIDSGYIIAGVCDPIGTFDTDVWLIKTDENGIMEWNRSFGGNEDDMGISIEYTHDGGYIIAADTESFGGGGTDLYLIKTFDFEKYYQNGFLVSKDLVRNYNITSINKLEYNSFIPTNTSIKIQFSQNNNSWYNSSRILDGWDFLYNGTNFINLYFLNWNIPGFYYRLNFSAQYSSIKVPAISNVTLSYDHYFSSGYLESQPFDSKEKSVWKYIIWESNIPDNTIIKFQIKSSDSLVNIEEKSFIGPDGNHDSYYLINENIIWFGHSNDHWIQYKAYFFTNNQSVTPILESISILHNLLPSPPQLIEPYNNIWTKDNKPTFSWTFFDKDSNSQTGFQLEIDFDSNFSSSELISKIIQSYNESFELDNPLNDGKYYWRVKTRDSEGDWGPFSECYTFNIDTTIEKPIDLIVTPLNWTSLNSFTIDWTNPKDFVGIRNGTYYYIGSSPPTSQLNGTWISTKPFNLSNLNEGETNIYIWLEDEIGNRNYLKYFYSTIKLDTTPPHSLKIIVNNGSTITTSPNVTLNLSAIDDLSGIDGYSISLDGINWIGFQPYVKITRFYLPYGDGEYTIYFRAVDKAGNWAEPVSLKIELNTSFTINDTDGDKYPDDIDKFPKDSTQWQDSDGDSYGDNPNGLNPDKFPNNSSEWNDTDGDNYGDNIDAFPNDASKWKKEDEPPAKKDPGKKDDNTWLIVSAAVIIIILVVILLFFILIKQKKKRENQQQLTQQPQQPQIQPIVQPQQQQEFHPPPYQPPTPPEG